VVLVLFMLLSGPLSSYYDVPHGLSNAVGLPYGMAYNLIAVPKRYARIAEALGVDTSDMSVREAAEASVVVVEELLDDLQVPVDLSDYFVKYGGNEEDIRKFAEEACGMFLMRNNPRVPQVGGY
jgi:alcohol dehydrogenase class IV